MSSSTTRSLDPAGDTSAEEVSRFVAAVRAQLDDLSVDEVTELTGGLEADLTDALAEEGATPAERYGDPAEYARELRSAAGLPPCTGTGAGSGGELRRFLFGPFRLAAAPVHTYDSVVEAINRRLDRYPWWPQTRDFLVVLRPAWWVLRAWLAVELVLAAAGARERLFRGGFVGFLLVLVAVVISVELGRRSPLPKAWQQNLILVGNVIAVLVLLPMVANSESTRTFTLGAPGPEISGLSVSGDPVSNIFPYDAQGRPLTGIQLYDQDGHQLVTGSDNRDYNDDSLDQYGDVVPETGPGTPQRWNVFPLKIRIDDDNGDPGTPTPAPIPFNAVPPLVVTPTALPSLTPSVAPTGTAAAPASPGATASPRTTAGPAAGAKPTAQPTVRPSATK